MIPFYLNTFVGVLRAIVLAYCGHNRHGVQGRVKGSVLRGGGDGHYAGNAEGFRGLHVTA